MEQSRLNAMWEMVQNGFHDTVIETKQGSIKVCTEF
jgi:hypothetical protein